jgi:hypothetical protein
MITRSHPIRLVYSNGSEQNETTHQYSHDTCLQFTFTYMIKFVLLVICIKSAYNIATTNFMFDKFSYLLVYLICTRYFNFNNHIMDHRDVSCMQYIFLSTKSKDYIQYNEIYWQNLKTSFFSVVALLFLDCNKAA